MAPLEDRIEKLLRCIRSLMDQLAELKRNSIVQSGIDQYYYIQKAEELKLLKELLIRSRMKENEILEQYTSVYQQWRKDARWLNHYLQAKSH